MIKFFLTLTLTITSAVCAVAQSTPDHKKAEFFVGYSYGQAEAHFSSISGVYTERTGLNGFNVSGVYNVGRYLGIKGDLSGTYSGSRISTQSVGLPGNPPAFLTFSSNNSLYNVLGGVQIKDNAPGKRVKPFAHALAGAGFRKNNVEPMACITTIICPRSTGETGLAGAFGGGLDVRVNSKIAFRAFQADYNPIKFNGRIDHAMRLGVGLVF